uniref:Uncharacterized protein n=1 Tax=Faecalibaculum rodentium TaxID=1702221 RepID=A0A140DVZ6_9FIRM|nr:hypothetical protein AALO17_16890 [Faecalibaculum rodentium]
MLCCPLWGCGPPFLKSVVSCHSQLLESLKSERSTGSDTFPDLQLRTA